ncbi:DegT/DnrJ/EryC1/StrS family aminotransferase [Nonomuraea helvata]|uniref:DegT/DnrJ/EryC1/StrS family aminotransferase n=1 Tax=Nonomuraea helvata TaxID=37484 RepID=A0ABV5SAH1_9ACTN
MLTYSRPFWDETELLEIRKVIESGTWTGGPALARFEDELRDALRVPEVVCLSSGTTAIQALLTLLRRPESSGLVVTSSLNFVAVASAALHAGYDLACTDIERDTLNMAPGSLAEVLERLAPRYAQIVVFPVHFAGLPCDIAALSAIARAHGALLAEDACHAIGAAYHPGGPPVGGHPASVGAAFSFHPTKPVAAGEGGALALADPALAGRVRRYRNHNMSREDFLDLEAAVDPGLGPNPWYYQVLAPGSNLRMSDLHAAVGLAQLARLPLSLSRRRALVDRYRAAAAELPGVRLVTPDDSAGSAHHLLPAVFDLDALGMTKREVFEFFRRRGILLQLHYTPIHCQPAFASLPAVRGCAFPVLDEVRRGLFSLPLFHGMTDRDLDQVLRALGDLAERS